MQRVAQPFAVEKVRDGMPGLFGQSVEIGIDIPGDHIGSFVQVPVACYGSNQTVADTHTAPPDAEFESMVREAPFRKSHRAAGEH
jgi:hypothetical protein